MSKSTLEVNDVFNIPNKACENIGELIKSPKFKQFLKYYNNLRKSQVTEIDLLKKYDIAMDAYNVWKDLELRGKVEPISQVQTLVRQMLDGARETSVERILPQEEIIERFQELGVDIQQTHAEWSRFYAGNKFFRKMLVQAGQIQEREQYTLPMPEINEGAMQAFESAFRDRLIDTLIIDDARLNNADIYQAHFAETINEDINHALPIAPQKISGSPRSAASTKRARSKVLSPLPKVRIVGFRFSPQSGLFKSNKFTNDLNKAPGQGVMEFTTLVNLIAKLAAESAEKLREFTTWQSPDSGAAQVSTILNNVNADGTVVLATLLNNPSNTIELENVKPDVNIGLAMARPTIQSDLA